MDPTPDIDDDQRKFWNGLAGRAWVGAQAVLDQVLKPFEDLLVEAVSTKSPDHVLDVGCGTGSTTVAVARLLGAKGRSTGLDISDPMIAAARTRAEPESTPPRFICANAQDHPFEPATFDMIISRFGVMFFNDPVRAFANLRHAARDNAELRFVAWRSAEENSFMTTAERTTAPLLPDLPTRRPDGPGQFGFGNEPRVRTILEESGWTEIEIRPIDVVCTMPEKALIPYLTQLGPVGRALPAVDDQTRAQIIKAVRAAFEPFVDGDEVRFTAASWMVSGRARSSPKTQ